MYIDLADPIPKSYAPKKGEEINRSTYSTMRYIMFDSRYVSEEKLSRQTLSSSINVLSSWYCLWYADTLRTIIVIYRPMCVNTLRTIFVIILLTCVSIRYFLNQPMRFMTPYCHGRSAFRL